METGIIIITTTLPSEEQALELARSLVDARLAACVHISPVKSVYRWEGSLREDAEFLLSAKVAAARADEAIAFIKARHPYGLPEILVTPVTGGDAGYLKWILSETEPG